MSAIDTQRLCEKAAAYGVDISAAAPGWRPMRRCWWNTIKK